MALKAKDVQLLQHIVRYCQQVQATMQYFRLTEEKLNRSFMMQNAVCMPVLQIGELANRLTSEFVAGHGEVPWQQVVGMRNFFAHEYEDRQMDVIWETITEDVPALERYCTEVLKAEDHPVPLPEPVMGDAATSSPKR